MLISKWSKYIKELPYTNYNNDWTLREYWGTDWWDTKPDIMYLTKEDFDFFFERCHK